MMDLIGNILMSYQRLCILAHSTGMSRRDVLGGGPQAPSALLAVGNLYAAEAFGNPGHCNAEFVGIFPFLVGKLLFL